MKISQRVPKSHDIWHNKGQVFSAVCAVFLGLCWSNVPLSGGGQRLWVKVKARGGECTVTPLTKTPPLPNIQVPDVAFQSLGQNERRLRD